jgi:hypothetical protein
MSLPSSSQPLRLKTVELHEVYFQAHWLNHGVLLPWLGNAIRGLLLFPLRQKWCLLNSEELRLREAGIKGTGNFYCQGCYRNAECLYGRIFEPDRKIIDGRVENGMREGLRAITIAPQFPFPERSQPNQTWTLRILAAGDSTLGVLPTMLEVLSDLGESTGLGSVPRARFSIDPKSIAYSHRVLCQGDLPTTVCNGIVPLVTIDFITPYFTRNRGEKPNFATLIRESIRTVRRALHEWSSISETRISHQPSDNSGDSSKTNPWNTAELIHASEQVQIVDEQIQFFQQGRTSARQQAKWTTTGWVGQARFRNVPISLLPWLVWGGILGVGESRNTGAGLWSVNLH